MIARSRAGPGDADVCGRLVLEKLLEGWHEAAGGDHDALRQRGVARRRKPRNALRTPLTRGSAVARRHALCAWARGSGGDARGRVPRPAPVLVRNTIHRTGRTRRGTGEPASQKGQATRNQEGQESLRHGCSGATTGAHLVLPVSEASARPRMRGARRYVCPACLPRPSYPRLWPKESARAWAGAQEHETWRPGAPALDRLACTCTWPGGGARART